MSVTTMVPPDYAGLSINDGRTFGIEIELSSPVSQARIVEALRNAGLSAEDSYYSGRNYGVWQVKDDCSLRPSRQGGHNYTAEVVSPILQWGDADSMAELATVSKVLIELGCRVNTSCGMHTHISMDGLGTAAVGRLIRSYSEHSRNVFDSLVHERRASTANHNYCYPLGMVSLPTVPSRQDICYLSGHGAVINTGWFMDRGTLEFRQRDGSVNFYNMVAWVGTLMAFIAAAEADNIPDPGVSVTDFLAHLEDEGYLHATLRQWVIDRQVPSVRRTVVITDDATVETVERKVARLLNLQGL